MRNLHYIVKKIIEEIPSNEKNILERFKYLESSIAYSAPESIHFWWHQVAENLENEIGEPKEQWQSNIQKIFNGE